MNAPRTQNAKTLTIGSLLAAAIFVAAAAAPAGAYCSPDQCDICNLNACNLSCCHEPPELWLVNTRCVPKCNNLDEGFERISVKRWDPSCRRFVNESWESLIAQEANMPTLIYAHGNTLKHKGAMKQCWQVYQKMRCCPGKKRLIYWSWPAQIAYKRPIIRPLKLILKNLRIKFVYSEYQGYYMAKLVQRMSLTQKVTLGGHSYGAIIAASAAHYLGGGELRGLTLEGGAPVERPNLRVALISGAFDNDSLYPGCRYGQAIIVAEKIWLTRNSIDSTLKNWPRVSYRGRQAIGVTGVNTNRLGELAPKICQQTMTCDVGKSHYIEPHLGSGRFISTLCCFAFPECAACAAAQQQAKDKGLPADKPAIPVGADFNAIRKELTSMAPSAFLIE